jgi:hypothetical protein
MVVPGMVALDMVYVQLDLDTHSYADRMNKVDYS